MNASLTESERIAELVATFERYSLLYYHHLYETYDFQAGAKAGKKFSGVAKELDTIPPGRRDALAALLDHEDPGVRTNAAIYLVNTMPERALAVLHAVHELRNGESSIEAMTALFRYECGDLTV